MVLVKCCKMFMEVHLLLFLLFFMKYEGVDIRAIAGQGSLKSRLALISALESIGTL